MPTYLVTVPTTPPTERLVEAANTASARNHVARSVITVTVAKGPDLFRIAKAGGEIEQAGQDPVQGGGLAELEELATTQTDDTREDTTDDPLGGQEAEPPAAEEPKDEALDTGPNDDPPEEKRKQRANTQK